MRRILAGLLSLLGLFNRPCCGPPGGLGDRTRKPCVEVAGSPAGSGGGWRSLPAARAPHCPVPADGCLGLGHHLHSGCPDSSPVTPPPLVTVASAETRLSWAARTAVGREGPLTVPGAAVLPALVASKAGLPAFSPSKGQECPRDVVRTVPSSPCFLLGRPASSLGLQVDNLGRPRKTSCFHCPSSVRGQHPRTSPLPLTSSVRVRRPGEL